MRSRVYLLMDFSIRENLLQRDVEFPQVVSPNSVMVPANAFQQRHPDHGQFERYVPIRVEGFADGRRRLARIPQGHH